MLHRLLAAAFLVLVPSLAQAAGCAGRDLIAALPAADRARLDAAVAGDPYAAGNWWRATREGSTIDIVGTFHIDDPRHDALAAKLAPVIAAADTVYLEATEVEMKALQAEMVKRPELIFITTGPTLPEQLRADEWKELSAQVAARGIPPFMASKFQPWYLMVLLGLPPCAMQDMQSESRGLDMRIMQAAKADRVPTKPLEPFDTVFRIFSVMTPAEQLDMVRTLLPMADQAEDMFATLTAAYFRGDHRLIWEYSRMASLAAPGIDPAKAAADFALMEQTLLTGRNRAWAGVILPAAAGRRIVVAVGAAHLSGPEGLLNLLAQAGYRMERQQD